MASRHCRIADEPQQPEAVLLVDVHVRHDQVAPALRVDGDVERVRVVGAHVPEEQARDDLPLDPGPDVDVARLVPAQAVTVPPVEVVICRLWHHAQVVTVAEVVGAAIADSKRNWK